MRGVFARAVVAGAVAIAPAAGSLPGIPSTEVAAQAPVGDPAGDPAGRWEGVIRVPGTELGIDVDLARAGDGWTGDISIPAQGATDLPLTGIVVSPPSIRFAIQGVPGEPTFDGTLDGDSIAGRFVQGGLTTTFVLRREGAAAAVLAEALDGFDEWMARALADFEVPGAGVGLIVDGKVVLSKGFGLRDVAAGAPVDDRTLFAIGSSTKAFTTFGLGVLADRGTFDWDRPIREYLPEVRFSDPVATQLITPRDMVTHRTGLPRHDLVWYNWDAFDAAFLIDALPHLELSREPREAWQYNNLMFVLAGHLLGTLEGGSWEAAVSELVLEPLGMDGTNFDVEDMARAPNHALPYGERGDTLARLPFRDISPVGPAGSINSSVADMLRWVRVHLERGIIEGDTVISAGALRGLHTPQMTIAAFPTEPTIGPMSYALGWFVEPYRGHFRLHHGGNIDGFSALVTLLPFDRVGVVVLTNKNATGLPELVTRHLVDRALGLEPRDWDREALQRVTEGATLQREAADRMAGERVTGTRHHHPLEAYAGTYGHPGYGEVDIRLVRDRLHVDYHGLTAPLEHWHYEVFSGMENEADPTLHRARIQFETDLAGRVAALRAAMEPAVDPIRFERQPDARLSDPAYLATLAGPYRLGPQTLQVSVRGATLVMSIPGQPDYRLEPALQGTFRLPGASGYWLEFERDRQGRVTAMNLHQPNGVFRAERVTQP